MGLVDNGGWVGGWVGSQWSKIYKVMMMSFGVKQREQIACRTRGSLCHSDSASHFLLCFLFIIFGLLNTIK